MHKEQELSTIIANAYTEEEEKKMSLPVPEVLSEVLLSFS